MSCLDTLALAVCMLNCKHIIITHINRCILNFLLVTNVSEPNRLALATVYSLLQIFLMLLGRKLLLISLALGQRQHHMVLWNSSPSPALTPPPTVKIAQIFEKSSDHLATRFEHTLLSWYPKPMQVIHDYGAILQALLFNTSYDY